MENVERMTDSLQDWLSESENHNGNPTMNLVVIKEVFDVLTELRENYTVLSNEEACALYKLLEKEWLDRDNYEQLSKALETLRRTHDRSSSTDGAGVRNHPVV